MLPKIVLLFGFIVLTVSRSIHRYELGDRYYYLKALKAQERSNRFNDYYTNHQQRQGGSNDNYNFGYSVQDPYSGDYKKHKESRKDGVVQGSYELIDPDGYRRVVDYTADDLSGFNAHVRRIPIALSSFGRFGSTVAPSFGASVFSSRTFGVPTVAPPFYSQPRIQHRFNTPIIKSFPSAVSINSNFNNYVSDYFNGYSETDFHQYY